MDPHHDRIERFSLAAHRLAVARLREQPERLHEARDVIRRWRAQAQQRPASCDPYWDEWDRLLDEGVDAVEQVVCAAGDHAAVLRSVSPLGRFVSVAERNRMLREARDNE
ncbi:MAG TPA: hypothetical protein VIO33_24750 [Burkholderiaceae bacterium]